MQLRKSCYSTTVPCPTCIVRCPRVDLIQPSTPRTHIAPPRIASPIPSVVASLRRTKIPKSSSSPREAWPSPSPPPPPSCGARIHPPHPQPYAPRWLPKIPNPTSRPIPSAGISCSDRRWHELRASGQRRRRSSVTVAATEHVPPPLSRSLSLAPQPRFLYSSSNPPRLYYPPPAPLRSCGVRGKRRRRHYPSCCCRILAVRRTSAAAALACASCLLTGPAGKRHCWLPPSSPWRASNNHRLGVIGTREQRKSLLLTDRESMQVQGFQLLGNCSLGFLYLLTVIALAWAHGRDHNMRQTLDLS